MVRWPVKKPISREHQQKFIKSFEVIDNLNELYDLHWIGEKRMIILTRMNGQQFYINATMVESIETTPDTVLTLVSGKKFLVRESAEEITSMISVYYRQIGIVGQHGAFEGTYKKDEVE